MPTHTSALDSPQSRSHYTLAHYIYTGSAPPVLTQGNPLVLADYTSAAVVAAAGARSVPVVADTHNSAADSRSGGSGYRDAGLRSTAWLWRRACRHSRFCSAGLGSGFVRFAQPLRMSRRCRSSRDSVLRATFGVARTRSRG